MRGGENHLAGLAQLHRLANADEVTSMWRQGMATLSAVALEQRPVPLEGLDPEALLDSVRVAISHSLVDDLDWLSARGAAVAVLELASALPASSEKRELGKRVFALLRRGDAATFVALATSLALGSRRAMSGPQIRARVALALLLPTGMGTRADALALALISRRDLEREWLSIPSTGSLPSRRLAARLIERAAREAAARALEGDDAGVMVFATAPVQLAWRRLLADRESLVWRHIATARGLLSVAIPACAEEIEQGMSAELGPTEWRRAAASVAASIAVDPVVGLDRSRGFLASDVFRRDPGCAGAMIFGLPCASDSELDAANELLEALIGVGGIYAIEALVDLREERIASNFGAGAAALARAQLSDEVDSSDDGLVALMAALASELDPDAGREDSLRDKLAAALYAFANDGPEGAFPLIEDILAAAQATIEFLEQADGGDREVRRRAFRALRELDLAILKTAALSDLLVISRPRGDDRAMVMLDDVFERLTRWLLRLESRPVASGEAVDHATLRLVRLRTLLHLIDADGSFGDGRSTALRERRVDAMAVLLARVGAEGDSPLRRTLCATLARTCDALLREEVCELSDLLVAVTSMDDDAVIAVLAEASMVPEFEAIMRAYLAASVAVAGTGDGRDDKLSVCGDVLSALAQSLPTASSARVEALRAALLRVARALESVARADSLGALSDSRGSGAIRHLESGVSWLAELVRGARRRFSQHTDDCELSAAIALRNLDAAVDRRLREEDDAIAYAVTAAKSSLRVELPTAVADIVGLALSRLTSLPLIATGPSRQEPVAAPAAEPLAPWLPPSRTLGGFYILRSIGTGAVGSVFVACRGDERHEPGATHFALKVPEYSGSVAHTLSEEEFLRVFRQEAGALLALPAHPNLAGFVTFDVGARPKPILVMELVEGPTIERLLDKEQLTVASVLTILDGVAAGLTAMHSVEVGHLDVKPANIILRSEAIDLGASIAFARVPASNAVLVDFGLAGRHLRPGCATVYYGAPEVWTTSATPPAAATPMAADVYSFSCLAYELLTGEPLFWGNTAISIVTAHRNHDGLPEGLLQLAVEEELRPLVELISRGLRKRPEQRASIKELRGGLASISADLSYREWPLGV